jgi:hypothetical protein
MLPRLTICALLAGTLLAGAHPRAAARDPIIVLAARPVPLPESPAAGERIGLLRPLGMLELPAGKFNGLRFAQLSALAWDDDEGVLYAVTDKGALFHLRPEFKDGVLSGVALLKAVPLRAADGKPLKGRRADAEGLDIVRGRNGHKGDAELVVSFERFPRIVRYRPDGRALGEYSLPAPLADAKAYRDSNKMLEAVCRDPAHGLLTVPEAPLRKEREGYGRIFSLNGKSWLYPLEENQRISAVECLGGGRVLLLERDFGWLRRVAALRLATLPATPAAAEPVPVRKIATLDAHEGFPVDNFEGLARHRGNRFFMVSDDNDLFVQRTLLLYFELTGD